MTRVRSACCRKTLDTKPGEVREDPKLLALSQNQETRGEKMDVHTKDVHHLSSSR